MNSYLRSTPPDELTIKELVELHDIDNEKVRAHYHGLSHELKTGEKHECVLCREVGPICSKCGKHEIDGWGRLRAKGWQFDIDGIDLCPACATPPKRYDFSELTRKMNVLRDAEKLDDVNPRYYGCVSEFDMEVA